MTVRSMLASKSSFFALGILVFVIGDAAISWGKLRMGGYTLVNGNLVYDCRPVFNVNGLAGTATRIERLSHLDYEPKEQRQP